MAALFQCFKKRRNRQNFDLQDGNSKSNKKECKCDRSEKLMQCPNCKSKLIGYWDCSNVDAGRIDGGAISKSVKHVCTDDSPSWRICPCRDSQNSSEGSRSPSAGNSPTTEMPPKIGNNNVGFCNDYTPSAKGGPSGMSYMFVSKDDPNYNMNHRRRGKAVIFNFNNFDDNANMLGVRSLDLRPREGSNKDKDDLAECLQKLNFEVVTYDNLKRQKFDKVINKIQREDHTDADCLVVAVMTHGEKNAIYTSCGTLIPVNSIWEEFAANKCPSLASKPKIFIIQACRGQRYDHGTQINRLTGSHDSAAIQNDVIDSGSFSYVIPNAADILVAFSCPLGHYSWRHPENGSWFIQSICKIFNENAFKNEEIQSLFTMVAREVALNYESRTNHIDSDKKKQVPSTSSTLIRKLVFKPKNYIINGNAPAITHEVVSTPTSVAESSQSTSQHISLQQVQVAVAIAEEAVAQANTNTNDTTIPPVPELVVPPPEVPTYQPLVPTVNDCGTSALDKGDANQDLESDEDPAVSTSQEEPILPPK